MVFWANTVLFGAICRANCAFCAYCAYRAYYEYWFQLGSLGFSWVNLGSFRIILVDVEDLGFRVFFWE